jgi:hypothetical protein
MRLLREMNNIQFMTGSFFLEKTNYESPRRKRRGIGPEDIKNTDAFTLDRVLL